MTGSRQSLAVDKLTWTKYLENAGAVTKPSSNTIERTEITSGSEISKESHRGGLHQRACIPVRKKKPLK